MIYFSAVVSVLFYWGVMQYIIRKIAAVMQITMETTAAESLNSAGNIFVGQVSFSVALYAMTSSMIMLRVMREIFSRS